MPSGLPPDRQTVFPLEQMALVCSIARMSFLRKRETLARADSHTTILVKKFHMFYEIRSFISVFVTGCWPRMLGLASPGIRIRFAVIRLVFRRMLPAVFWFTPLNYFPTSAPHSFTCRVGADSENNTGRRSTQKI
jgi:hypothetical protein